MKFLNSMRGGLNYGVSTICIIIAIIQYRRYIQVKQELSELVKTNKNLKMQLDQAKNSLSHLKSSYSLEPSSKESSSSSLNSGKVPIKFHQKYQDKLDQAILSKNREIELLKSSFAENEAKLEDVQKAKSTLETELEKVTKVITDVCTYR